MEKKKKSGVGKLVQSFEDFKKVVTKEITIEVAENDIRKFVVHAITPKRRAELAATFNATKPLKPALPKDAVGSDRIDPHAKERESEYEKQMILWSHKDSCWTILGGWVEPNRIEIPGKTDAEKVEHIFESAPSTGFIRELSQAIDEVSGLKPSDVDFM